MSSGPILELESVVKRYNGGGEAVRAVDGVSLSLRAGEMVALQGPSGSGKSTLLMLTAGLLAPDEGTVTYDRRDLAGFSEDEVADHLLHDVGFVHQRFELMPRASVLENAAMKLLLAGTGMREARRRALPWVERVGLGERVGHTPEQLSGGERQRVALARVLAAEPRLILADEPTGNLDSARSEQIVALLHELAHEGHAAVLLVTHDADAARSADRTCQLRDGRIVAEQAG